jgi:hypothetical protein
MDIYAGDASSLLFEFKVDGEFVTPSTATYTLRGNSGAVIVADQAVSPLGTQAVIGIDAGYNTVADGLDFEQRFVDVKFVFNGNTQRVQQSYRVRPFIPLTGDVVAVRSSLGVLDHELSDDDVDLYSAYLVVRDRVGSDLMATALASGTRLSDVANQAVVLYAALVTVPMLMLRAAQSSGDDTLTFERLAKIDLDALAKSITDSYELAVTSIDPNFVALEQFVVTLSTPTDPVTGA